ncbi:MAG: hypothetical protein PeribacterA2_0837 [Candidatus Peribacter riflensis]|nr:MAG: hypothetical protein PeribacterA2_0837 [Candidatus Peribacter riflensis]ALM14607.1 MAG: hypothetical protein PeribacterD2_0837 [Candidatus Peribacter riflensis]
MECFEIRHSLRPPSLYPLPPLGGEEIRKAFSLVCCNKSAFFPFYLM